ncbi:MAG: discoidin domain-containing protein [Armatimonadetes bacterium]|nr:discoidin domain-containing protein [Armatimonadota bacterium]
MPRATRAWRVLAIAAALLAAVGARAECLLKPGDRVVIYGDSITEQRMYSRYLQQYIDVRYPELKVRFFNCGWGGDTAGGATGRLERDVLWCKPTVATLFFGMNDGGYHAVEQGTTDNYSRNMENLIKGLQAAGVRVIVYTPGCVDGDRQKRLADCKYNEQLEALGKAGEALAKKYNCQFADIHHPMLDIQTKSKAAKADFTMIPDSVHPNAAGHLVMARYMLAGLGAEPMPAMGSFNVANDMGEGLRLLSKTPTQAIMETTAPVKVPFWFEDGSLDVANLCGMTEFSGQKLTVKGMPAGTYQVTVDGANVVKVTADELAAGVNVPGTWSSVGRRIHDMVQRKEDNFFTLWRQVRLPLADMPESKAIVDGLMAADEGYHAAIWAMAGSGAKATISVSRAPEGPNLAKGRKYECSDPNTYNWGIGKLTDGSWDPSANGCFATGASADLPKTVTVDLETPTKVGTVVAGVPHFGSTKTIKVSLSLDGTTFTEVGSHEFVQRRADRWLYSFEPVEARYVRLTYPDRWPTEVDYPTGFAFTTEVEVYAGK